ncbi:N-acetyl-gamma-glutamyl-phosphate reductase [Spirochaetia bacterium]|nr:N-acetyl-gamma-glutamyl-phosphate reductase [Spirochaetia bacterium]
MIAGIIGAAGYAGAELIRLLEAHPDISGLTLASVSRPGERISGIYPNLFRHGRTKFGEGILVTPEELIASSDIVFGALPAGAGEVYAKACLDRGISYIDLAADFRFDGDEETYKTWYGKNWQYPELRRSSVYGLPELNRERIKELKTAGPVIIGNPGCYPTAVSLACYPLLAKNARPPVELKPDAVIIADAISGVTGAGREPGRAYHFPECADSVSPYKVGVHRHTPEISRNLAQMAGRPVPLVFTPHLGPYNRGILATVYLPLRDSAEDRLPLIREHYVSFYRDEPFVRVLEDGLYAATNRVRLSNYGDISVHPDQTGTMLIIAAAIDNMVKGAAGQAVQNMNILCGFEETAGLLALPAVF